MEITEASSYSAASKDKYDLVGKQEMVGLFEQFGVDYTLPGEEMFSKGDIIFLSSPSVVGDVVRMYERQFNRIKDSTDWRDRFLRILCETRLADLKQVSDLWGEAEARDKNTSIVWAATHDLNHPYYLYWRDVSVLNRKIRFSTADLHFSVDYDTRLNANLVLMMHAKQHRRWENLTSKDPNHTGDDLRASITLNLAVVLHRKTPDASWEVCHHPSCRPVAEDNIVMSSVSLITEMVKLRA